MTRTPCLRRLAVGAMLGATLAAASSPAARADATASSDMLALLSAWLTAGRASIEERLDALEPAVRAAAAPAVAALIAASRDDALARGVEPIPAAIRSEIGDYVPSDVLDAVRRCPAC